MDRRWMQGMSARDRMMALIELALDVAKDEGQMDEAEADEVTTLALAGAGMDIENVSQCTACGGAGHTTECDPGRGGCEWKVACEACAGTGKR